MRSNHSLRNSKLFRALLILLFVTTFSPGAMAQLTFSTQRTTLGSAIKQIQSQSSYQFFYNDKLSSLQVNAVNAKNSSIENVLSELLKNKGIAFKIEDNIVYLSDDSQQKEQNQKDVKQTVKGIVTDATGEPLIGVSVLVKGTTQGSITNIDGEYEITAETVNPVLTFSYIGYQKKDVAVNEQKTINVTLSDDTQAIDEVVITALGIKRATKALSYNVQEVKSDALLTNKDANFINALAGKVAGVTINSSSSGVGGASKVVMRGTKGIDQSSNALYVIDGVPMFNLGGEGGQEYDSRGTTEAIADINPEDIESMSVLTGAAAAALYGSHAANGAIVITTKKGKEGKVQLTVTQNTEFTRPFRMPKFQNRYGTGDLQSATSSVEKSWGNKLNDYNRYNYSPADDFLRTGVVTTETVSLSTGTERNQTYFSASAVNSAGMVPNNDYNRYNFSFRNTTSFLNDKMMLDVSANYINQNDMNMVNQGTYSNPLVTAYLFPRGDDWNEIKMYERFDTQRQIYVQHWPQDFSGLSGQNPYWIAHRNLRENTKNRYIMSANLQYNIFDWLNVSGRVRIDNANSEFTKKLYATSNPILLENSSKGLYGITTSDDRQTYADFLVNINKTFNEKFSLHANLGASYSDMRQSVLEIQGPISDVSGIANVFNVLHLDNAKTRRLQTGFREQTQSIFGSVEFGYKSAYFLTVTGRTDWPSQLAGPNSVKSCFFYPSVGASVVLSEIMNMPEQLSYLKLRGSFASVGLPFPRFLANPTYEWDQKTQKWAIKTHYPMYDLKPEKTDSWEVGITARFLKHFNFDLGLYLTKTYNQTFEPNISVSSKYSTMYVQTGSVQNKGIEMSLGYQNAWKDKIRLSSTFTFSANRNKILELMENYVHPETGIIINLDRLEVGGLHDARFILRKGGSLGDLYSVKDLQRDNNGNIYVNEKGEISSVKTDDIKLGSIFPKANMSWRNDIGFGNFNLGFMFSARLGGICYSATQAAMDYYGVSEASANARDFGGVMINGNDMVNAQNWYSVIGAQTGLPQYYTYSATNVRLQEASLSYTIPQAKLKGIADITLSLVGRNLWMIYCKAPFDPESVATTGNYYQGIDNFMTPNARNVGFNVRLKF